MEFVLFFFFVSYCLRCAVIEFLFGSRLLDTVSRVLNKDLVNAQGLISSPSAKEKKKVR